MQGYPVSVGAMENIVPYARISCWCWCDGKHCTICKDILLVLVRWKTLYHMQGYPVSVGAMENIVPYARISC